MFTEQQKYHIETIANIFNFKDIYIVGGCVRDFLLKKPCKDIDFATSRNPDEIVSLLNKCNIKTLEIGKSFGVIVAILDNEQYEIATFREDIGEGRRPDSVKFTTIENDVKRRDFTINGLFIELSKDFSFEKPKIIDLVGGLDDLKNKIIKTIGNAEDRFREDPLRKLRALRFSSLPGFSLHEDTYNSILNDNTLDGVSKERIFDELYKTLSNSNNNKINYFNLLLVTRIFKIIFPNLENNLFFAITDIIKNKYNFVIILFLLIHERFYLSIDKKSFYKYFNELTFPKDIITDLYNLYVLNELIDKEYLDFKDKDITKLENLEFKTITTKEIFEFFYSINSFNVNKINKLLYWLPTIDPQMLIDQGFKGKELGDEIKKLELLNLVKNGQ